MNDSAASSSRNSTNGRAVPLALRLMRLWFRIASAVAPRTAERQAASLFLTPPRKRHPAVALEDAAAGRYAFTVRDGEREVAAWSWGSGPVVLLAHGWGGTAADMAPLAERLQRAGYRAVLVDFPAHGRSPGRRTNMVEWLGALRAVSAAVGPIHAAAGHSFGAAAIALSMSELELDVRGVALLAPAAGPVLFLDRFTGMIGLPKARAEGMMRYIARTVGREPASLDARIAAASLQVPALVVHDPADREVPWEHAETIADAWRGSRLVAAEGLGHTRLLRDDRILRAVMEFLGSLPLRAMPLAAAS